MNHDPYATLGFEFTAIIFATRDIMDRDGKRFERCKKSFCGNEAMALQSRIAFHECRDRHPAGHFILGIKALEPNTLPVKQSVFIQESELTHMVLPCSGSVIANALCGPSLEALDPAISRFSLIAVNLAAESRAAKRRYGRCSAQPA
jgi:hypothetical protein